MKVLVLHSELGVLRGGGENFTKNLFTAFAARGHQVSAAFVADCSAHYPIAVPVCIEPIPIRGWWSRKLGQGTMSCVSRHIPSKSPLRARWDALQEAVSWRTIRWHDRRFQRRVEAEFDRRWRDYDTVYVHGSVFSASRVARHLPTLLRLPGPVTSELAPALRSVHAVCANGDALTRIRAFLGDHASELPVGLDERIFFPGSSSIRQALGWSAQHRVVGYVGRLTQIKGVDLLARAFREITEAAADVRLLIIGDGEEKKNIHSVLAKEIARGIVHIHSDVNHDQLSEWYRAMDVLAMPSRYENFSNAILEAMACGVPVLASDVGGNRMLHETGAGWLFAPESVHSLQTTLQSVIANASDMKARGRDAACYVRKRYSWMASAERLEQVLVSRLGLRV